MSSLRNSEEAKERHREHMKIYARERRLKLREELGDEEYRAKCRADVHRRKRGEFIERPKRSDEERKERLRILRQESRDRQRAAMGVEAYNAMINEKAREYRKRVAARNQSRSE